MKTKAVVPKGPLFGGCTLTITSHSLRTGAAGERECVCGLQYILFCSDQLDGLLTSRVDTAAQSWHIIGACSWSYDDVFVYIKCVYHDMYRYLVLLLHQIAWAIYILWNVRHSFIFKYYKLLPYLY